jgi:DNA repair protein RecO (recombination protein O)
MKVGLHPCFILHQRPFRETSMILEVFSREHGKLALVARGVKKRKPNLRSIMQPNQKLNIAWVGRGEMGTLTAVEASDNRYILNGRALIASFYVNELLMRLLHRHEPCPRLFDVYEFTLERLQQQDNEQSVLRNFELRLLESLGYGLLLEHDITTGAAISPDQRYYYQLNRGPTVVPAPDRESITISGGALLALAGNALCEPEHLHEVKLLTRKILKNHLGPKPLASRALFNAYLKNQPEKYRKQGDA